MLSQHYSARPLFTIIALLALVTNLKADVALASPFSDHAVIQRDKAIRIWGRAEPGEAVSVTFANLMKQTRANADGRWSVELPPLPASAEGRSMLVEGKNSLRIENVLVGEVWLCAGQSNMEFSLSNVDNAAEVIPEASLPLIREFKARRKIADLPQDTVPSQWTPASTQTAGKFSAVAFFFARRLHAELGVPVGIVNCSHGGTPVEAWLDTHSIESDPRFEVVRERWAESLAAYPEAKKRHEAALADWTIRVKEAKAAGKVAPPKPAIPAGPGHHLTPSGAYNGILHPILPFAVRGIVWYQGESNGRRADEYLPLFEALIMQLRNGLQQGTLPFFWVQLPGYGKADEPGTDWVTLREAQASALRQPQTAMAIAIDLGDATNIHPSRKLEVGERLARIALRRAYGQDIMDEGPEPVAITCDGAYVRVRMANCGEGLSLKGAPDKAFAIAGEDGVFHPADTVCIEADTLVVSADAVEKAVALRYNWAAFPQAFIYNSEGLPAAPFRSDKN